MIRKYPHKQYPRQELLDSATHLMNNEDELLAPRWTRSMMDELVACIDSGYFSQAHGDEDDATPLL